MQTFEEWLELNHPEMLDESWRDFGKKVAIGGALLGAGMGLGRGTVPSRTDDRIPSMSVTSPNAANFLPSSQEEQPNQASNKMHNTRFQNLINRLDRKRIERNKGTPKEIKPFSDTSPDASNYLPKN